MSRRYSLREEMTGADLYSVFFGGNPAFRKTPERFVEFLTEIDIVPNSEIPRLINLLIDEINEAHENSGSDEDKSIIVALRAYTSILFQNEFDTLGDLTMDQFLELCHTSTQKEPLSREINPNFIVCNDVVDFEKIPLSDRKMQQAIDGLQAVEAIFNYFASEDENSAKLLDLINKALANPAVRSYCPNLVNLETGKVCNNLADCRKKLLDLCNELRDVYLKSEAF